MGPFLIENGKVTRPIKNMRWNESPIFALNNLEMLGRPERVSSSESGNGATNAPANLLSLDGQLYQFTMTFSPARCDRVRNTTSMLANVRALTDLCVGYSESSPRWSSDQEA